MEKEKLELKLKIVLVYSTSDLSYAFSNEPLKKYVLKTKAEKIKMKKEEKGKRRAWSIYD